MRKRLQGKSLYLWYAAEVVQSDRRKYWSSERVAFDTDGDQNELKKQHTRRVISSSSEAAEENFARKVYPRVTANDGTRAPCNIRNVNSAILFRHEDTPGINSCMYHIDEGFKFF